MTVPGFAVVAGEVWANRGPAHGARGDVHCEPVDLDESAAIINSRTVQFTAILPSGEVEPIALAAGQWQFIIPDGEIIGPVTLTAGESYELRDLRGYVPPPGVTVQVIEVPQGLAEDVADALEVRDEVEVLASAAATSAGESAESASQGALSAAAASDSAEAAANAAGDAASSASAADLSADRAEDAAEAAGQAAVSVSPSPLHPDALRIGYPSYMSPRANVLRLPIGA